MNEQAMILSAKTWNDCANQERGIKPNRMIAAYATLIEQQAARIAELEGEAATTDIMVKTAIAERIEANGRAEAAEAEVKRLREALEFYANPEIYKPHPHGSAFDKRHTLCFVAEAALSTQGPRHD